MVYVNGINNLGTVSGALSNDGGSANGGHDLPAVSPIGAAASTPLPLQAGIDNVDVYDLADDGTAVGLAWTDDFSVAKAYYYSPVDGVLDLPVDNTTSASRGNVISADGHVVGGWSDDPVTGFRRGVVWKDRVATYVQDGNGDAVGETDGISGNGQWAVGSSYPAGGCWRMEFRQGPLLLQPLQDFCDCFASLSALSAASAATIASVDGASPSGDVHCSSRPETAVASSPASTRAALRMPASFGASNARLCNSNVPSPASSLK